MGTGAGCPFSAHVARTGGNSNRSVSSSNSPTLRRGRLLSRRRIAVFFLLLRVLGQDVAGPLPDEAQVVELPPDGVGRQPTAVPGRQLLAQQRHRPVYGGK